MKQIQKYRSFLSIYTVIVLVAIGGAYFVSLMAIGFHWIIAILTFLILLGIIRIYTVAISLYKQLKEYRIQEQSESEQQVSINDILNQESTEKEEEQNNQEEELDRLIHQLSDETEPKKLAEKLLSQLGEELHIVQGLIYQYNKETAQFEVLSTYAYYGEEEPKPFQIGEGLSGQVARDQKHILLEELPEGYTEVISGLGKREPKVLLIAPFVHEEQTVAIAELAFFEELTEKKIDKFGSILNKLSKHFA